MATLPLTRQGAGVTAIGGNGHGTGLGANVTLQGGVDGSSSIPGAVQFNGPLATAGIGSLKALLTGTGACLTADLVNQAGNFSVGQVQCTNTTGASTLIVAPGYTAAHGWVCYGTDLTTAEALHQSASSTSSCTIAGTVNANDYLNFIAIGY